MSELNARIARTMPGPFMGMLAPSAEAGRARPLPASAPSPAPLGTATAQRRAPFGRLKPQAFVRAWLPVPEHRDTLGSRGLLRRFVRDAPAVWLLLAALLLALWPHWVWMARRLTDGSDEPWGILALATVAALVFRDRARLALPSRAVLIGVAALALVAAAIGPFAPPPFAAAVALLALGVFLAGALPRRPAAPLVALLLLALPIVASLQFYFGYPLRFATAHAAAPLLAIAGFDVAARGAAFEFAGRTILVDPPCAGIGMLWVGSCTAALLSYLAGADARRTLANGAVAAAAVFAANVLRNALLFFPESGLVAAPAWAHDAVGLAAFAAAIAPIVAFAHFGRA
ncbi:MAG: hypothetical protein OHK0044_26710 [Burkholderiaceae bacterium]